MKKMPTLVRRARKEWKEIIELKTLSRLLNMDAGRTDKTTQKVERIISGWLSGEKGAKQRACDEFNEWAAKTPVTLFAGWMGGKEVVTQIGPGILAGDAVPVWMLWHFFFGQSERHRLKRCPECQTWFADKTRNGSMIRCSTPCTNKWWTIERRRKAGHKVPGSTRQPKRRATP